MGWQIACDWTMAADWGTSGYLNVRNEIPANESSYDGTKIRITITAGSGGSLDISGASIGVMTSVDDYDSAPTRITWDSGNNGCTVSASSSKVSDEITFSFDKTVRHGIHIYSAERQYLRWGYPSAYFYWTANSTDYTLTQTVSFSPSSDSSCIDKLEVFEDEIKNKFSNDAESKLLAHIFKNTQYSQPSNIYVALCKSTIEDDDTGSTLPSEVSGGSYQRTLCNTWDTSTTPGTADSDITIEFPKATAAWGTITDFAICDAQTLGNVICYGKFTTTRNIGNGDRFIIDTGDLDATLS